MNNLLKVDSIMFFVSNLERAAKFYEEALGLKRIWTDGEQGMIGFRLNEGDSEIVIHNDRNLQNPSFSFLVENVEKFYTDFLEKGHSVVKEPFEVRCGKYAILADPDGNELPIIDLTKFGSKPKYD